MATAAGAGGAGGHPDGTRRDRCLRVLSAQRRVAAADLGPVRYLAVLAGVPADDMLRWFVLSCLLDPAAVLLLLAATSARRRLMSSVDYVFVLVMLGMPVVTIALSPSMGWADWALLIIVMTGLTAVGRPVRAIVRHNAPLYGVKNIVIVGAGYGFLLAAGIFLISRFRLLWDPMPIAAISLLSWWGFLAAGYIGFQPDPMDSAGNARQTAFAAMFIYVVTLANLLFVVA
jgi:hypothetical protein